ncbi:MAG TPA: hypothetical protein VKZ91_14645 [Woeseiaceae bacterium]|nr:hypothetical protein [Woeseiaceae bacterium]
MPRSVPSWLLLSLALAVVLWLIATVLENSLRAPEPVPPDVQPAGEPGLDAGRSPDSVDRADDAEAMSCQESEDQLKLVIEDARSCTVDDDCTLFDYGYPLDCMTSVAKDQIPRLREEYRRYGEACEHRVFYDCPTAPYVRLALCRNNQCIVELDKRDDLEGATLDQLNRGRVP